MMRNFLSKQGKKHVVSTATGRLLIDAVPDQVKDPTPTAGWEQALEKIADGKRDWLDFIARQASVVEKLVTSVTAAPNARAFGAMEKLAIYPCPECKKPLHRRKGHKGWFWGCSGYPECKVTLPDAKGKPGNRSGIASRRDRTSRKLAVRWRGARVAKGLAMRILVKASFRKKASVNV
ncbi:MAG: topoisomerase DNA-binding C4 zinc finger domain-containing protein [Methylococcales bacterium]